MQPRSQAGFEPRWPFERHARIWSILVPMPDADIAHDELHVLRVYRWALRLAPEAGADPDLTGAAALVHDLEIVDKGSSERALGGERSARRARPLLVRAGYAPDEAESICSAVAESSWSAGHPPTSAICVALQDADRLDALGAVGIARVFACAQSIRASRGEGRLYHPLDPFGEKGRELDDARQALDHFELKLLRLAGGMQLETSRTEAASRHATMVAYLTDLRRELGHGERE